MRSTCAYRGSPSAGQDDGKGRRPDRHRARGLPQDDFVTHFAAGVDPVRARVLHAVQQPVAGAAFGDVMGTPAWKSLPSWFLVATGDQAIPPDAERAFASRMGAATVEVAAGHLAMVTHPGETADLVKAAAEKVSS